MIKDIIQAYVQFDDEIDGWSRVTFDYMIPENICDNHLEIIDGLRIAISLEHPDRTITADNIEIDEDGNVHFSITHRRKSSVIEIAASAQDVNRR